MTTSTVQTAFTSPKHPGLVLICVDNGFEVTKDGLHVANIPLADDSITLFHSFAEGYFAGVSSRKDF